jgi:phage shock protein E
MRRSFGLMLVLAVAVGLVPFAGPAIGAAATSAPAKVSCSVSSTRPFRYTTVMTKVTVLDRANRPIRGAKVRFSWRLKSGTWNATRSTTASGVATCAKPIGAAPAGYKVVVRVTATAAGRSLTKTTSFTPATAPASGNISNAQLRAFVARGARLVDVRTPGEYVLAHIAGASNVPSDTVPASTAGWNKRAPVVVYCQVGYRSLSVATCLRSRGFRAVYNLGAGMAVWDGPMVPGAGPSGGIPATGRPTLYDFFSPT